MAFTKLDFSIISLTILRGLRCDCPPDCTTPRDLLWQRYLSAEYGESEIGQHVSTLRLYASRVNSVTEMGVQRGLSTWALLQGLSETASSGAKIYRAFDLVLFPHEDTAKELAASVDIDYSFARANVLGIDIAPTDLLFIDTFHSYPQLRGELRRHAPKAHKYIIMHDTTIDGNVSECARLEERYEYYRCELFASDLSFSLQEVRIGIWQAIQEFLSAHHEWELVRRYSHNNGLTILERRENPRWRQIHCDLNLTISSVDGSSLVVVEELLAENILAEYERLVREVAEQPSAWGMTRLGILLAFFMAPLKPSEIEMMTKARAHFTSALRFDQHQPHALLAYAHTFCPHWQEVLRQGNVQRASCSETDAATSEEYFRKAVDEHDMWEAHLALSVLLLSRGAINEAHESYDKVRHPLSHPIPMGALYWQSVLCHSCLT